MTDRPTHPKIDTAALLARVNIVDVIERYVPDLKKSGAEYEACCPFHTEETPSFKITPTKGFYHCFGCGAHGDAIALRNTDAMRIIGQTEIAAIFGVTPRTINEWQDAGMPVAIQGGPGVPGEYDSEACIRWRVEREVAKVQGPETPKDRLARLQGDDLEMKIAQQRGKLIDTAAVEPAMRAAIVSARERIRNEPGRIATLLEGLDHAAREARLRDLFDEVLTKLSCWQQVGIDGGDQEADELPA